MQKKQCVILVMKIADVPWFSLQLCLIYLFSLWNTRWICYPCYLKRGEIVMNKEGEINPHLHMYHWGSGPTTQDTHSVLITKHTSGQPTDRAWPSFPLTHFYFSFCTRMQYCGCTSLFPCTPANLATGVTVYQLHTLIGFKIWFITVI